MELELNSELPDTDLKNYPGNHQGVGGHQSKAEQSQRYCCLNEEKRCTMLW